MLGMLRALQGSGLREKRNKRRVEECGEWTKV